MEILINHIGYDTGSTKRANAKDRNRSGNAERALDFVVVKSESGEPVFRGKARFIGYKGEVVTLIVHHNRGVAESGTTSRKGEEMEASPVSYASKSSDMIEST